MDEMQSKPLDRLEKAKRLLLEFHKAAIDGNLEQMKAINEKMQALRRKVRQDK